MCRLLLFLHWCIKFLIKQLCNMTKLLQNKATLMASLMLIETCYTTNPHRTFKHYLLTVAFHNPVFKYIYFFPLNYG